MKLSTILEFQGRSERTAWINPDYYFLTPKAVPFIFTPEGKLLSGKNDEYHGLMLINNFSKLGIEHGTSFGADPIAQREWAMDQGWLLGRIGAAGHESVENQDDDAEGLVDLQIPDKGSWVVTFWNPEPSAYASLNACMAKLFAHRYIVPTDVVYVSTPVHGTVLWDGQEKQAKEMSPEEKEKYELHKQLHLMRGDQKRQAMKKLGVDGGGRPHPMQSALRDAGLNNPGQKWWAPHSESFNRLLSKVLAEV